MKFNLHRFVWLLLVMLMPIAQATHVQAAPGDVLARFGARYHFGAPASAASDSSGNIYIADQGNHRIQKFSPTGDLLLAFGSYGTGNGQFAYLQGVAVDGSGNIFVADTENNRIQKFDPSGHFLSSWGTPGNGSGQFSYPSAVAVDASGYVYVADTNNHRIQKFTNTGAYVAAWGSYGSAGGQFSYPSSVAIDNSGTVFVADAFNNRIERFSSSGTFLSSWGSSGAGNGQFARPGGIGFDASGNVFIADTFNHRVQKLSPTGAFIKAWGSQGAGIDQFSYPTGLTVSTANDNVYVTDTDNNRVLRFDNLGYYRDDWSSSGTNTGQFNEPSGVAVDSAGNLFVTEWGNDRFQKFSASGAFMGMWGSRGQGPGQLISPNGIAADSTGHIFISDVNNYRVQKFDGWGTFMTTWGSYGDNPGQFTSPGDVALDGNGNVYVADGRRVQKFDANGNYLTSITYTTIDNPPDLGGVSGMTVDGNGNIYVSDYSHNRIMKFDRTGAIVSPIWIGFEAPSAIAVDANGYIYAVDSVNNRMLVYDSARTLKGGWGNLGEPFDPSHGYAVAVNASGSKVYVADTHRNTVTVYEGYGSSTTFAINCGGPGFTDSTGQVYVADAYYSGGSTNSTTLAIPNTVDDKLYQNWRYGNMGYNIPIANGNYNVTLKFSDWYSTVGKRVFDVQMERVTVLSNFDIVAKAGYLSAYDVVIPVTVNDGVLNIQFINKVDNAKINAILIKPAGNSGSHTITATAGTGGSITPAGNIIVAFGGSSTFTITPNRGYKISDVKVDGGSVGPVGTYTFNNVIANHTIAASFTTSTTGTTVAINCGGTAYTDSTGRAYVADTYYSGGYTNSTTSAIPNTVDDKLYQNWRYGNMSYNIPVQNGNYNVILKFSDWYATVGKRVFDVKMEGTTVLSNLDIFAKAGYLNPYDVTIPVTVTDGVLNIQFINKVDNAKINAILIKPR